MIPKERETIRKFAEGDMSRRDESIAIYRKYLVETGRHTDEMRFMAEIDNDCPDLALRVVYRERLTGVKKK